MAMAQGLLAEFEQEGQTTRNFLERVPEDKLGWKPHDKSMTLGQLALHIALSPGQVCEMAKPDEVPMPDFGGGPKEAESRQEILDAHDQSMATVKQALTAWDDAALMTEWKLNNNGTTILQMPRVGFLRSIMMNHVYHHRGQLSVYLRLLDVPVPSAYGPSADEVPAWANA